MQISAAILCDFASVREGLLFVMGGNVTRLRRPTFPAPLNLHVALVLDLHPMELERPHEIELRLQDEDGQTVVAAKAAFQTEDLQDLDTGEHALIPFVLDLRNVSIPKAGRYSAEIAVDGSHQRTIGFRAVLAEATRPD